jgi:hypothetical protein
LIDRVGILTSRPALAGNLENLMRTLAMSKAAAPWLLTSLRGTLHKIGGKIVRYGLYVIFQPAEVAVPRQMSPAILSLIGRLRAPPAPARVVPGHVHRLIRGRGKPRNN